MDIIFGAVTYEAREASIKVQERRLRYELASGGRRQSIYDLIELPLV